MSRLYRRPSERADAREADAGGDGEARHQQVDRQRIARERGGGEHAEDRLREEVGGEAARTVTLEQPQIHDEVEARDEHALVGEYGDQAWRPLCRSRLEGGGQEQ